MEFTSQNRSLENINEVTLYLLNEQWNFFHNIFVMLIKAACVYNTISKTLHWVKDRQSLCVKTSTITRHEILCRTLGQYFSP